ncbi:MAG: TonB-dependent receptor plug domain-containing protein [Dysgonamonadaceae bacterium]|nr:TonB-dependent receptor plug domain-containing protein [Dysgonamonadaceae bacterium]
MNMLKDYYCFVLFIFFVQITFARDNNSASLSEVDTTFIIGLSTELEEVVVMGKSKVKEINESAYNVVAIDAKSLHNTTLDLAHALDRISGVKIRETGGVGSNMQIFLNGFSGRHVKVFIDGMPIEGFGSSFRMENIPVTLADRIEVYKGVVPVELGSDALGGAINIVTKNISNTYLDASYSYGSFNTHKSNVNFGYTTKTGLVFQVNVFQNYSDNDYKVKTVILDVDSASAGYNTNSKEEYWVRRFHDKYRNETLILKAGFLNKPWASRLMFGVTLNQENADIQNANLMKIAYGGREYKAKGIIPSIYYSKKNLFVEDLHFSLTANYNASLNNNIDTLARQYNWRGEYAPKSSKGEGQYSLSEYNNNNCFVTANLNYQIDHKHYFAVNNVYNYFTRKATDAVANYETSTAANFMRRVNSKNVLGLSYKFEPNRKWNLSAFVKYYEVNVTGPVNISKTSTEEYEEQSRSFNVIGYGIASTYRLTSDIQLKSSFEKSYRLPSERELLGDEILEKGNVSLKPENSYNLNLNIMYSKVVNKVHSLYLDMGFIYRDTRDYIRRQIEQRYGGAYYTNHGRVRNLGIDTEARYFYKKQFSIGGNFTCQNMQNKEKYSSDRQLLITYNDRMPNVPYLFGNMDMSYNLFDCLGKGNRLSFGYNFQYVHRFFNSWQSEGNTIIIPKQIAHDLNLTYTLKDGKYNVTFEAKNITGELLYDNYSLQKPGRSFSLKFRYFFLRRN